MPGKKKEADQEPQYPPLYKNDLVKKKKQQLKKNKILVPDTYCVIDIETTGLSVGENCIIEIGARKVRNGTMGEAFSSLILCDCKVTNTVKDMTGITEELLQSQGRNLKEVLQEFIQFIGDDVLLGYHIQFDLEFIEEAVEELRIPPVRNKSVDILKYARHYINGVADYKLRTVAAYLGINTEQKHRALYDCDLTVQVYEKLKEKWISQ